MVDKADVCSEVTVAMLLRRRRFKCCERVLSNALHSRGYWFHTLRKKMILPPDDAAARFALATKYKSKTREWWLKTVHVHLDNHHFKVVTIGAGRKLLAKRATHGVYRLRLLAGHRCPRPMGMRGGGGQDHWRAWGRKFMFLY